MAETLTSFDWSRPSVLTKADKADYPWDQWLDGDVWKLTYGEDFQTHPLMMERIIRTRATGRRSKVRIRHAGLNGEDFGEIIVQRTDIVGPAQAKKDERAAARQAKKAQATVDANATLKAAGITPTPAKNGTKHSKSNGTVSKIPAKRVAARQKVSA